MANIQSQIKRNRQNSTRHDRNRGVRTRLKTDLKTFRTAHEDGDVAAARDAFAVATRALDKAASKGIIHANKAANNKSRMARKLAALEGA